VPRTTLTEEDRQVIRRCNREWGHRRRIGQHSLHTHALSADVKKLLEIVAARHGMKLEFREEEVGGQTIRYLVAQRLVWRGPRPGQQK
jgi:hypothetical protein